MTKVRGVQITPLVTTVEEAGDELMKIADYLNRGDLKLLKSALEEFGLPFAPSETRTPRISFNAGRVQLECLNATVPNLYSVHTYFDGRTVVVAGTDIQINYSTSFFGDPRFTEDPFLVIQLTSLTSNTDDIWLATADATSPEYARERMVVFPSASATTNLGIGDLIDYYWFAIGQGGGE